MKSWDELADEASALLEKNDQWPDAFPQSLQRVLTIGDRLCIAKLGIIMKQWLPDEEKCRRIRRVLTMRWQLIANSSLDYTRNPNGISNAWYVSIAERIANDDIDKIKILKILMPSITRVIGSACDLESIQWTHLLVNANQDGLIVVDDIFEYAHANTNFLFPVIATEPNEIVPERNLLFSLTAEEREVLRQLTPESQHFFDLLHSVHRIRYQQKPSVGYALLELSEALLKSSKIHAGSDEIANLTECAQPIRAFYAIWTALSVEKKQMMAQCRARYGSLSIEALLLVLFAHTPGIVLSDILLRQVNPAIIPCTHMLGSQLQEILKNNLELHNMPLPDREQDFLQDALPIQAVLDDAKEKCIRSLSQRSVMVGSQNDQMFSQIVFFDAFTNSEADESAIPQAILQLQPKMRTLVDLKNALLLLPETHWDALFLLSRSTIVYLLLGVLPVDCIEFITRVLRAVKPERWLYFFDVLDRQRCHFLLPSQFLGLLFDRVNASQWKDLAQALHRYFMFILQRPRDVANFFNSIAIDDSESMYQLFQSQIDRILQTPEDYATVFVYSSMNHWSKLFQLFSQTIHYYIQNQKFLSDVLERITDEGQLNFMTLLVNCQVAENELIQNLPIILSRINPGLWPRVLSLLDLEINAFPKDVNQFLQFLRRIPMRFWRYLNLLFHAKITAITTDVENLCELLNQLSEENWEPFFDNFFANGLRMRGDAFIECLKMLRAEKRLAFLELQLNNVPLYTMSADFFAKVLQLLSISQWEAFLAILTRLHFLNIISNATYIKAIMKTIPPESWPRLKSVFLSCFEDEFCDDLRIILFARELPLEKIAPFFEIIAPVVKNKMVSWSYMKNIFVFVQDEALCREIVLSIAAHVNPLPINLPVLDNVIISALRPQKNNLFLLLKNIDTAEAHRFLKNIFASQSNQVPSDLAFWENVLKNPDTLKKCMLWPLIPALMFDSVPVADWPALVDLFSEVLRVKFQDIDFVESVLLLLPHENRYAFCKATLSLLPLKHATLHLLQPIFFALQDGCWRDYFALLQSAEMNIELSGMQDLASIITGVSASQFQNWYQLLHPQIDRWLAMPANVAKLFSLFDVKIWPKIASICQLTLVDQFEKTDFLKKTLGFFKKELRPEFLQACANHFEQIPLNASILNSLFSDIDTAQWKNLVSLLGCRNIARAIAHETDLSLLLHGIEQHHPELLNLLHDALAYIHCEKPEKLMYLLRSQPNCESALLHLFQYQLVGILRKYLDFFMMTEDTASVRSEPEHQTTFDFFVIRSLPILLSRQYLESIVNLQSDETRQAFNMLCVKLSEIDHLDDLPLLYFTASRCKFKVMHDFIEQVKRGAVAAHSDAEQVHWNAQKYLYDKLMAHFGLDFFKKMPEYASCFKQSAASDFTQPFAPPGVRPRNVVRFARQPAAGRLFSLPSSPRVNGGSAPAAAAQSGQWLSDLYRENA